MVVDVESDRGTSPNPGIPPAAISEIVSLQNPFVEFALPQLSDEQESAWNHYITTHFMSDGRIGPLAHLIHNTEMQMEHRVRTMQFLLEPSMERYKNNMNLIGLTPRVANTRDTIWWVSLISKKLAPYAAYQIADYIPTIERELSEKTISDDVRKMRCEALATYNAIIPVLLPKLSRVQAGALFEYFDNDVMHRYIRWDVALENIIKSNANIIWKRKALVRTHAYIQSQKPAYVSQPKYERVGGDWVKSDEDLQKHSEYHEKERKFRETILEVYKRLLRRSLTKFDTEFIGREFPVSPELFQEGVIFLLEIDKQHKPISDDDYMNKAYGRLSSMSVRRAFARREFLGGKHTEPDDYCEHKDWGINYLTNADLVAFARAVLRDFPDESELAYLNEELNHWEKSNGRKAEDEQRGERNYQNALQRMRKP